MSDPRDTDDYWIALLEEECSKQDNEIIVVSVSSWPDINITPYEVTDESKVWEAFFAVDLQRQRYIFQRDHEFDEWDDHWETMFALTSS